MHHAIHARTKPPGHQNPACWQAQVHAPSLIILSIVGITIVLTVMCTKDERRTTYCLHADKLLSAIIEQQKGQNRVMCALAHTFWPKDFLIKIVVIARNLCF